jgi:hypothetical protein
MDEKDTSEFASSSPGTTGFGSRTVDARRGDPAKTQPSVDSHNSRDGRTELTLDPARKFHGRGIIGRSG